MMLDNYLCVTNSNGEDLGSMSCSTTSVGYNIPDVWAILFTTNDAVIDEKDHMLVASTIGKVRRRLESKISNNEIKLDERLESVKKFLNEEYNFKDDDRIEIYFGTYGDLFTLEEFKNDLIKEGIKEY